jgi:hypothetical protein
VYIEFYSNFYTWRTETIEHGAKQAWVFDRVYSRLTQSMVESLQRPIAMGELQKALANMAFGKSPGPDGITVEFYRSLWPVFGEEYLAMLQTAISRGSLPHGVTEGLIVLLHKGGARSSLNNWRPITLLNVSYKLFTKVLQMRLQPVLMELISPDQSAFLPMRYILDNIFLTQETISYAKQSNQPLLFLKLDFSKAYDKVDLRFLFQALHHLGFPPAFTGMVRLLFLDAAARVSVNGKATSSFPIQQGVRQGCPLAPYLFLVVGEILNHNSKREARQGRIQGINLPGASEPQIIAQFADDTSLFITAKELPVRATHEVLQRFCTTSSLLINKSKSSAYFWHPQLTQRLPWTADFHWQWMAAREVSKLLGVPFGLTLSAGDVDQFLFAKVDKKLLY